MTGTLEELELIASVASDLPVGLWVARAPGGEVVFANKMFAEIVGSSELAGPGGGAGTERAEATCAIHDLGGAPYPTDRLPFARTLRERRTVVVDDLVVHRPDGSRRNVRARGKPILRESGEVGWVAITFSDVTREFDAEKARNASELRLLHAQKMEAVGTLAGGIAHDFNNMLTSIKMLISLLEAAECDAARRENLARLSQVSDSAVHLTRSLLGLARHGKGAAHKIAVDDVVGGVGEILRRTIDTRVKLELRLGAKDSTIVGHPSQLEQIVLNLAVNARDAMCDGGSLCIRTAEVDLDETFVKTRPPLRAGPHVLLEIADTGSGIDPAIRHRIFEPYFTTRTAGPIKGTGLGLATVRGIIDSHGGAIEVCDAVPRGTVMKVMFPAAGVRAETGTEPAEARVMFRGSGLVLVADDDPFVRESSCRALRHLGYDVLAARDGDEAMSVFLERRGDLAAVMLDLAMPCAPGLEVWRAMRDRDSSVPVLLITAHALEEEARRGLEAGVKGVLSKPFDVATLSESLRAIARKV